MASALAISGYDVKTAWGDGGHDLNHGGGNLSGHAPLAVARL